LAFLQIFGMECVAMILEKNLDNQILTDWLTYSQWQRQLMECVQ